MQKKDKKYLILNKFYNQMENIIINVYFHKKCNLEHIFSMSTLISVSLEQ